MKNYNLLIKKIEEGMIYIEEQDKKLEPVIDYLCDLIIEKKEELDANKAFEYFLALKQQKVNSLLLLSKMQEVLNYLG